jgi:dolichyl-phosphate beta-glucosyltransferase
LQEKSIHSKGESLTAGKIIPEKYSVYFRYTVVGLIGTAIDIGLLYVFVDLLRIHLLLAAAMSFVLAVINNFTLNKYWTFQSKISKGRRQFMKFMMLSAAGLLLTEMCMAFFVYGLKIWYISAKLITSAVVLTWNFLAGKYWTFKDRIFYTPTGEEYKYDVTVIIPAYNEQNRIEKTVRAVNDYFRNKPLTREIIVVDDGSGDSTERKAERLGREIAGLRIITYRPNRGKGYAIKKGVEAAHGEYILFIDADNSTPIEEFDKFYPLLKDVSVVIGSRYLSESNVVVRQPWYRVMIGRFANILIRFFILDGVKDTQCGFKAFQHDAAKEIFSRIKVTRYGFDIEALAIARLLNFPVKEIPVSWYNSPESRIRPVKDAVRTFVELIYIKLNLWGGRYS